MSRRDVLRILGEPAVKSSTKEMLRSRPGWVIFADGRPENAKLWLYPDHPEPGDSTMVRFVRGKVHLVDVRKK